MSDTAIILGFVFGALVSVRMYYNYRKHKDIRLLIIFLSIAFTSLMILMLLFLN